MTITITDQITPTFTHFGPFCIGATIPDLPTTSINGITGTWGPAINNTATTLYTFTPSSGLCATTATMTIAINDQITPTFADFGPSASALLFRICRLLLLTVLLVPGARLLTIPLLLSIHLLLPLVCVLLLLQ